MSASKPGSGLPLSLKAMMLAVTRAMMSRMSTTPLDQCSHQLGFGKAPPAGADSGGNGVGSELPIEVAGWSAKRARPTAIQPCSRSPHFAAGPRSPDGDRVSTGSSTIVGRRKSTGVLRTSPELFKGDRANVARPWVCVDAVRGISVIPLIARVQFRLVRNSARQSWPSWQHDVLGVTSG